MRAWRVEEWRSGERPLTRSEGLRGTMLRGQTGALVASGKQATALM